LHFGVVCVVEGCVFEKQCSAESYVGLLQCDVDVNTAEPQDTLTPLARKAVEELGSPCTTVSAIISTRDPAVFSAISQGLERANQKAASKAQKVQKWTLLDTDFSLPGGELGTLARCIIIFRPYI
jgi:hypothetical protein